MTLLSRREFLEAAGITVHQFPKLTDPEAQDALRAANAKFIRRFGVMYQTGALWSSLTLAENVAAPVCE